MAHARLAEVRDWLLTNGFGLAGSTAKATLWSLDVEALIAMGNLDNAEIACAELRSRAKGLERGTGTDLLSKLARLQIRPAVSVTACPASGNRRYPSAHGAVRAADDLPGFAG